MKLGHTVSRAVDDDCTASSSGCESRGALINPPNLEEITTSSYCHAPRPCGDGARVSEAVPQFYSTSFYPSPLAGVEMCFPRNFFKTKSGLNTQSDEQKANAIPLSALLPNQPGSIAITRTEDITETTSCPNTQFDERQPNDIPPSTSPLSRRGSIAIARTEDRQRLDNRPVLTTRSGYFTGASHVDASRGTFYDIAGDYFNIEIKVR
jgi:hypothetical protein